MLAKLVATKERAPKIIKKKNGQKTVETKFGFGVLARDTSIKIITNVRILKKKNTKCAYIVSSKYQSISNNLYFFFFGVLVHIFLHLNMCLLAGCSQ